MTRASVPSPTGPDLMEDCPVCIGMMNQVAHNPDHHAFDQASIELDLHPEHRPGAVKWAEQNPEWTTHVR